MLADRIGYDRAAMTFKRRVLLALGKEELLAIGREVELDVKARMSVDELRDVVAKSKRATLDVIVSEALSRDALKAICTELELSDVGAAKSVLIERILAAENGGAKANYKVTPDKSGASVARDDARQGWLIDPAAAPATKAKPIKPSKAAKPGAIGKLDDGASPNVAKPAKKRRGGATANPGTGDDSEAFVSGTLKAALRQFALGAAGGYTGRDAAMQWTTHLLECFGWPDGRPPEAELGRQVSIADGGLRVTRELALWWPARRTMLEVVPHDVVLDFAWKDVLRVCLQLDPVPQYVVLTNQRDLALYDLARDREAPRLAIRMDDLPKYSEAFPFFTTTWVPGSTPRIVNVEKVSGEVAELVARLFRSVRAVHPTRERDVIRFTLQCITAMFAEDIGLLPKNYFTSLLYDGARSGNVEARLRELFTQMNDPAMTSERVVPYFNGGLFTEATNLPLGQDQVIALTKAAEANWTYVDPHIFGSVFQGIMNDAERHASGSHYTAHDDIMRVVGPTIVEPWRKRILAASSLGALTALRNELVRFRVLDPACGSGNFLYVAFRELYRLDTELLSRMREFPSTKAKLSWNSGISTTNFFGIDINPFAVELAKVTLNIAKKIAFEERKEQAFALAGQVEMEMDPSLPLDNLDKNVVCADALFTDWPEVEAIVGNPPFLGGLKIRSELGEDYLNRLQSRFPGVNGRADFCSFWFRLTHERLLPNGRAGLVATNSIREGNTREASMDYIVRNGGTIVNAVSSQQWPGESVVNVSMVNWVKGAAEGEPHYLIFNGMVYERDVIPPSLQLSADLGAAHKLAANANGSSQGLVLGTKEFQIDESTATSLRCDARAQRFLSPMAGASHLLSGRLTTTPDFVIDMSRCATESSARQGGSAFTYLQKRVYPLVQQKATTATTDHYKNWLRTWWRPFWPRVDFLAEIDQLHRIVVCSRHAARPIFTFLSRRFFPTESLQLFGYADDYSFGVLQSICHWGWAVAVGSKIKDDTRYTSDVWERYPWPQDPTDAQVTAVVAASRNLRRVRAELMETNGWSLRQLYQSAEVPGPHPLNDAQAALDAAVNDAYGLPPNQDSLEFLLELNQLVAEDEAAGRTVRGPGLPPHLDPKDPRWTSTDCIQPPPLT